jgi:hypothetical protein
MPIKALKTTIDEKILAVDSDCRIWSIAIFSACLRLCHIGCSGLAHDNLPVEFGRDIDLLRILHVFLNTGHRQIFAHKTIKFKLTNKGTFSSVFFV